MNSTIIGMIRTVAATIAGLIVSYLARTPILDWLSVDSVTARDRVTLVAAAALTGVYYTIARWAESRIPQLGWLLGVRRTVTFTRPVPATPPEN